MKFCGGGELIEWVKFWRVKEERGVENDGVECDHGFCCVDDDDCG